MSLEPQLFTLNHVRSYQAYNDASTPDTVIEQTMHSITQGLFSVIATLGVLPVIRCPKNDGPSRMVAEQLNQLLREHVVYRYMYFDGNPMLNYIYRRISIVEKIGV